MEGGGVPGPGRPPYLSSTWESVSITSACQCPQHKIRKSPELEIPPLNNAPLEFKIWRDVGQTPRAEIPPPLIIRKCSAREACLGQFVGFLPETCKVAKIRRTKRAAFCLGFCTLAASAGIPPIIQNLAARHVLREGVMCNSSND